MRVTYYNSRKGSYIKEVTSYWIKRDEVVSKIKAPTERSLGSWRKCYIFQDDLKEIIKKGFNLVHYLDNKNNN